MARLTNRQFKLIARPVGMPKRADFEFTSAPVAEPGPGEVLVKVQYISLDPAMRGWMNEGKSSSRRWSPRSIARRRRRPGHRIENAAFAAGDHVTGWAGVQEYSLSDGNGLIEGRPRLHPCRPIRTLGMPGMTATSAARRRQAPVREHRSFGAARSAPSSGRCRDRDRRVVGIAGGD
jgi:NADPH-dependent curcumin reductase CurA